MAVSVTQPERHERTIDSIDAELADLNWQAKHEIALCYLGLDPEHTRIHGEIDRLLNERARL